jgi:hypothetical protein
MSTTCDHPTLEQLLGTVAEAMTTPVLVLDAETPPALPHGGWSTAASRARRSWTAEEWSA